MNSDADKFADHLSLNGNFYEPSDGTYDGCVDANAVKHAILQGMEWAYRDAIKAAKGARGYGDFPEVACWEAIEARLK